MIAKVYLNRSKEYLIDRVFLRYTMLYKYLKVIKPHDERLYKNAKVQIEKSHIGN